MVPFSFLLAFSGTDFVMVFPRVTLRLGGDRDFRRVQIVASEPTLVNITSDFNAIDLQVTPSTTAEVDIDTAITLLTSDQVTNKVLRIKAEDPITIHGVSYRVQGGQVGMDSYLIQPLEQLGNQYILVTTNVTAQFAVAAVDDGTNITVFYPDGTLLTTQILNSLEVYTFFHSQGSTVSLSGSVVLSDKPVAVFSGGYFANVPAVHGPSRDSVIEQIIPVKDWYTFCIIAPFFPDEEYAYEVVGSVDGTILNITQGGSTSSFIINRSGVLQELVISNQAVVFTSDNPILAVSLSVHSAITGRAPGDAAMVQCLDPDKYLNIYTFFVNDLFDDQYIRIIILDEFKSDLILNGLSVLSIKEFSLSVTVPDGDLYTVLYVVVQPNVEYVLQTTSGARFGAVAYGFIRVGQYIHNLGQLFL